MAMKNSAAVNIVSPDRAPIRPSKHATAPYLVPETKRTRTVRARSSKRTTLHVIKIIAVSACMALMLSFLICERAELMQLNRDKADAEEALRVAQSESVRLQAELNSVISVDNVEVYAREKLGMVKRMDRQIQFFKNGNEDEILLVNPLEK